jgi:hypothetical protein
MKTLSHTARLAGRALMACAIFAGPALATGMDDVAKDFKPVSGVVAMVDGPEIIIELDAAGGIRTGDVFSVLAPGKPIIHPVTQKVIGNLEDVKAVLKVTRLKTGFSFARPIGDAAAVQRGDLIRSYYSLPAIFWDYSSTGRPLFEQLQSALPDLKWQDYESAQRSKPAKPGRPSTGALTFILTPEGMEVRDPEFTVLKYYPAPHAAAKGGTAEPAPAAAAPIAALPQPSPPGAGADAVQPVFSRTQTVANLPEVALMTDFVREGGRLLMASTNGSRLHIYDMRPETRLVATAELAHPGSVLALKWWQPAASGPLYLAVTAWVNDAVQSSVWMLQKDVLRPTRHESRDILGSFDLDRDGTPETLLAQEFDRESFFGQRVREASLRGDELRYAAPKVALPRQFIVLGSAIADLDGDGRLESIYLHNKILFIYSGSRQLYKSPKEMGGSVSVLTFNRNTSAINAQPATAVFETSPLCADLDKNGTPEVIVAASERTLVGSFVPSVPDIKRSWIAVVRYQAGRFEMGTLGEKLEQPVQGMAFDGQQVLVVTTDAGSIAGEGAQSHLLAFALKR